VYQPTYDRETWRESQRRPQKSQASPPLLQTYRWKDIGATAITRIHQSTKTQTRCVTRSGTATDNGPITDWVVPVHRDFRVDL